MTIVYPIRGEFWPQDEWGRVTNIAVSKSSLQTEWMRAGEESVDAALLRFNKDLHSVYLCGPAARRRPGGASFIILLQSDASTPILNGWGKVAAQAVKQSCELKFPVKFHVVNWKDVFCSPFQFSPARFRLATNSVCVGGRNVERLLQPQEITEAVANTLLVTFEKRIQNLKLRTLASDSRQAVRNVSAELGHAIVSAGYATLMACEQTFTEDLDLRRDIFALHYADKKDDIQRAYDMAALPSCDPVQVRAFINEYSRWVMPLVNDWLNKHNPYRANLIKAN